MEAATPAPYWTRSTLETKVKRFHCTDYTWGQITGTALNNLVKSAVLVPLVIRNGDVYVWLTLRATHLRHDGGHVAFPGGKKDAEDADEGVTCLRESHEEIGLERHLVDVIAVLPPRINARSLIVTPVVGIVEPSFKPVINHDEVDETFLLPLSRFLSKTSHSSTPYMYRGFDMYVHFFHDVINDQHFLTWGLTASICLELAAGLFNEEPEFLYAPHGQINTSDPFTHQRKYLEAFKEQQSKL